MLADPMQRSTFGGTNCVLQDSRIHDAAIQMLETRAADALQDGDSSSDRPHLPGDGSGAEAAADDQHITRGLRHSLALQLLHQGRKDLMEIANHAEIGHLEDGGALVLIDSDDVLRVLHAVSVLGSTTESDS